MNHFHWTYFKIIYYFGSPEIVVTVTNSYFDSESAQANHRPNIQISSFLRNDATAAPLEHGHRVNKFFIWNIAQAR